MIIVLDTNFIVCCAKQKIDFTKEIERVCNFRYTLVVPGQVIEEVKKLSLNKNIKDREAAMVALHLVEKYKDEGRINIKKVDAKDADSGILKFDNKESIIATLDKALKQKIRNAKVITIRQRKHIEFI